ncbi:MAG: DUF1800 domain-containing protein [Caldilineaceae bacterium]|nr:DUF1800 domain-containing protein [Caldilineaceae bacterium]
MESRKTSQEPSFRSGDRLSRRDLLARGSIVAAAGLAGSMLAPAQGFAQDEPVLPAMRRPDHWDILAAADVPAPPAPEIIALNRMAFGPRPGDLAALMAMGKNSDERLTAYVEQQLSPATIDDAECDTRLTAQGFTTLAKTLAQQWADHVTKKDAEWSERIRPASEVEKATIIRAIYSKRQLLEVLADFWHNHFNVYGWDSWSAGTWVHYDRDVIRANVFGNFRQMLEASGKSPAMLYYLDNISNSGGNANENYARELFELHGMGAENYLGALGEPGSAPKDSEGRPLGYIDSDVYQATLALTGWRLDEATGAFRFDDTKHHKYEVYVLNGWISKDAGAAAGTIVMDRIADHPGTARYIARKLCRRLISDNPPESVVQLAADVFYAHRSAADQLKRVVRAILLSSEFRNTWAQKVKRPFEYAVSLMRVGVADFVPEDSFFWRYDSMGQPLFSWRPPNGYPDMKEDWSTTMPMLQRWRFCNYLIDGWRYGGDGPDKDKLRMDLDSQMPANIRKPTAIVDYWASRILGRSLPDAERQPIVDFLAGGRNPDFDLPDEQVTERLRFAVALIFMAPSFLWR